jgi:putative NADPH-quinone reductase
MQPSPQPPACLIVIAHPLSGSLCRRLGTAATEAARAAGAEATVRDLYAQGFDPVLTAAERAAYTGPSPDTSAVAAEVAELAGADMLVLVFPTWWFGFPAILKGWFDRVWLPGIAFAADPQAGPIRPRLDRLREVVAITTLGSPWWFDRLVLRQPVRRVLARAIVGPCAKGARLTFLSLHGAETVDRGRLARFEARVTRAVRRAAGRLRR